MARLPAKALVLGVPYSDKDEPKAAAVVAGVRLTYDRDARRWWAPPGTDPAPFSKWLPKANARARP